MLRSILRVGDFGPSPTSDRINSRGCTPKAPFSPGLRLRRISYFPLVRVFPEIALTFAGLFLLTLILQFVAGAFTSELAGYPDEPSHYVTGLMVRDYIVAGAPAPPIQYASDYYRHYPKVALGHWPPVFYLVQAGWTLIFTPSRISILLLMASITALLGTAIAWRVRSLFGRIAGVLAACAFIVLPCVQAQTAMVMPDILLALFGFQAALHFGNYLETENWRESVWFAVFASLCILSKGNGWALALLPPIATALTRKPRPILRPSFLVSALLAGSICASWYLLTAPFARHVWLPGSLTLSHASLRFVEILKELVKIASPELFVMAVLGMVIMGFLPAFSKREVSGFWACMIALFWAVLLLNSAVPLPVESRKLMMALPPMLMLILAGLVFVSGKLLGFGRPLRAIPALLAIALVLQTFTIPKKAARGFVEAAGLALSEDFAASSTYFVSGTSTGEGAFIAEVAMRDERPRRIVLRASKALASSDWNGSNYQLLFSTTEEIRRCLHQQSVSVIVMEDLPVLQNMKHHILLTRMLDESSDEWVPVAKGAEPTAGTTAVKVFRRAAP